MGTPQKDSFANKVRAAVKELSARGAECTTDAISHQTGIKFRVDHKRMLNALRDMTKAGELSRVSTGVYALAVSTSRDEPECRAVMWRILRMRRAVTVADLVEMASASLGYAAEWLRTLERHGVVRSEGGTYRLLKDTVEMPELTDNADKLRNLRAKKKQAAMAALEVATQAIGKAKAAINDL